MIVKMIAETISDICIIGALGVVGLMLFKDVKARKQMLEKAASVDAALDEIREVRKEFFTSFIQAKQEGQNLKDVIISAENIIAEMRIINGDMSAKTSAAVGYMKELDEAIKAADRSCGHIAETMSDASRRFAKINIQREELDVLDTLKPISEKVAEKSLRALRAHDNVIDFGRIQNEK